jgi:hypothetical protein
MNRRECRMNRIKTCIAVLLVTVFGMASVWSSTTEGASAWVIGLYGGTPDGMRSAFKIQADGSLTGFFRLYQQDPFEIDVVVPPSEENTFWCIESFTGFSTRLTYIEDSGDGHTTFDRFWGQSGFDTCETKPQPPTSYPLTDGDFMTVYGPGY